MNDPYKVLGVGRDASDDEVKRVYRELARKYHPDNYVNNPLADLAQEKMKEINEAYDVIVKERAGGGSASSSSSYGGGASYSRRRPGAAQGGAGWSGFHGNATGGNEAFTRVRQLITSGNTEQAEQLLNSMPPDQRGAEWNFLMGSVYYSRGWLAEARMYYERAVRMEPGNQEYASALQYMNSSGGYGPYRTGGYGTSGGGCSACDICAGMMCADMLCNCC